MTNADTTITAALMHNRMLQCMRRVLLVDIEFADESAHGFARFQTDLQYDEHSFDAVVLRDLARLKSVADLLAPHAAIYVVYGDHPPSLDAHGLIAYVQWPGMIMAVRADYNPIAHAHYLLKQRRPKEAHEVLVNVPAPLTASPEIKAALAAEMQWCFLAIAAAADAHTTLNLFFRAQEQFFVATTYAPYHTPSYLCHARHWQCIGRPDMARRLLRTCRAVAPSPDVETMLAAIPDSPAPNYDALADACDSAPDSRRLLIVCHEGSDYGLDTLYDGLCDLLGDDTVVEVPWKATLHGKEPERAEGYPCVFDRRGDPVALADIEADLRAGAFDAVLFADTLMTLDHRGVRQIMDATGDTPLVILDTWDEGGDYRRDLLAFLGRDSCHGYFKREMLAGVDYGPDAFPLPFAYSYDRAPRTAHVVRDIDLFWAGKPAAGLRPVYLDRLEAAFGLDRNRRFSQAEYRDALQRSRIGLNLFGYGFDTVRYWEVPAHGAMLLAERPPICIPHNFVDGVHAVFFDDLPDLEAKLDHYLRHPDEAAAIAAAGHDHFLRYHTATARARQFLVCLAATLHWP